MVHAFTNWFTSTKRRLITRHRHNVLVLIYETDNPLVKVDAYYRGRRITHIYVTREPVSETTSTIPAWVRYIQHAMKPILVTATKHSFLYRRGGSTRQLRVWTRIRVYEIPLARLRVLYRRHPRLFKNTSLAVILRKSRAPFR